MSNQINVVLPAKKKTSYPVLIETGLLSNITTWLPGNFQNIIVITDHLVKQYYGNRLLQLLKKHKKKIVFLSFQAGERNKTIKTKQTLENAILNQNFGRDAIILALGGGVVGDISGFVAATYMRGIPYIQIPTSLLAMLDSSIGGKTGVNTRHGKNLIGAFWQPEAVIIDPNCISTLPKKHIINGAIEALKMFLTSNKKECHYFHSHRNEITNQDIQVLTRIIKNAINIKAKVVQQDECEKNIRKILNFGHTIGHAIEKETHYKMLHGVAVGYGMLVEAKIAQLLGYLSEIDYQFIYDILIDLAINPSELKKFPIKKILNSTRIDKKNEKGYAQYVLLTGLGSVYNKNGKYAHFVSDEIVTQAINALRMGC